MSRIQMERNIMNSQQKARGARRGRQGEKQVRRLFQTAGWRAGLQPGSGAPGARSCSPSRQGDVWAYCGDARFRVEVKHYKNEPRTMRALRAGSDVLAYICKDTGKLAVFIDEDLFRHLLAWSADALSQVQS